MQFGKKFNSDFTNIYHDGAVVHERPERERERARPLLREYALACPMYPVGNLEAIREGVTGTEDGDRRRSESAATTRVRAAGGVE